MSNHTKPCGVKTAAGRFCPNPGIKDDGRCGLHTGGRQVRTELIMVRMYPAATGVLDKARGGWTKAEFVRRATEYAIRAGFKGPNAAKGDVL